MIAIGSLSAVEDVGAYRWTWQTYNHWLSVSGIVGFLAVSLLHLCRELVAYP